MCNYPPGMTARDMDHVEGRGGFSCPSCGEDLSLQSYVRDIWICNSCKKLYENKLGYLYEMDVEKDIETGESNGAT